MPNKNHSKKSKLKDLDAVVGHFVGYDTNDLFIDIKFLDLYRKAAKDNMVYKLGINVFVFDIDSCEFFEEEE